MKQVNHVESEREILSLINHPFMVRMFGTDQDRDHLYIIMEFVSGGEFFSFLRRNKRLDNAVAKFYAAHIVLILEYLHHRRIVYRDLKPENLLMNQNGYLKLTDFGFAKYLATRTYTLCGTPEYIAPEILLNKGHGFSVDWWALGVFIYEMIVGYPPFCDEDALGIYQKILSGRMLFPRLFPRDAKSLVKHLLCHDLVGRMGHVRDGISDVRDHRWFRGFDFKALLESSLKAPFIPPETVGGAKNFGTYTEDVEVIPMQGYDPFDSW
ncbi:putative CAMP-dependent protein kinase catalytic subunit [Gregarina niphandrodes]|uniref:cAMP-dependent protein kinase catalytic subunit n=1 Tax=Gregarina niphandrodes TaxID=110365 RepID=A0A023B0W2_GRENI|nr:putative CAMP-dependent protein kinase catalytic subunit [Gregarina niphandrodes]EZG44964.1 putative CAMP-dependent protein kinase catalytic subunit [Gregarina niphandrodes]|eukprot:XP_011132612.1 putative CAMP-dependent protein kinase catalytic subunit [Gregarina niphandrodes]